MGETEDAMSYDDEIIFKHLWVVRIHGSVWTLTDFGVRCFYLDSPDNARKNGMSVRSKHEKDIAKRSVIPAQ